MGWIWLAINGKEHSLLGIARIMRGGGRAGVYPWPIFVGPFYPVLVSKIGVGDLANAQK